MDKYYLNEYSLRQSSIYELRNIGREVGVLSPTTLKKEDLIKKILKILSGNEKPEMPKNKKGRPPKKLFIKKNYLGNNDVKYKNNYLDNKNTLNQDDEISILSSRKNYENEIHYESLEDQVEEQTGYYTEYDDSGFIFECGKVSNVDSAILVHKNLVEKYDIKCGDLIKCRYRNLVANNTRFLTEVLEKNNNDGKQLNNEVKFENLEIVSTTKTLSSTKKFKNVYYGSRNILFVDRELDFNNIYEELILECSPTSKTKFLNLKLEVVPEELKNFKKHNNEMIENFYTVVGDNTKQNIFTVELFINRIKRLAELQYNIFITIDNILKLVKYKNFIEGNSIKDIKNKSLDLCFNLLSTARNFSNNSVTLFAGIKNLIKDDFYNNILEELSNVKCNFLNYEV